MSALLRLQGLFITVRTSQKNITKNTIRPVSPDTANLVSNFLSASISMKIGTMNN